MKITATIKNSPTQNLVEVSTNNQSKTVSIPPKLSGQGSSINGGELLFLSLATCFCNDIYREADRRKINIKHIDATVSGDFGKEGEPASNIKYHVNIESDHRQDEIIDLIHHVDKIAEVHNTLRKGTNVELTDVKVTI